MKTRPSPDFPLLNLPEDQLKVAGDHDHILQETVDFIDFIRTHHGFVSDQGIELPVLQPADLIRKNQIVAENGLFFNAAPDKSREAADREVRRVFAQHAADIIQQHGADPAEEETRFVLDYMLHGAMPDYDPAKTLAHHAHLFEFDDSYHTIGDDARDTDEKDAEQKADTNWAPYPTFY